MVVWEKPRRAIGYRAGGKACLTRHAVYLAGAAGERDADHGNRCEGFEVHQGLHFTLSLRLSRAVDERRLKRPGGKDRVIPWRYLGFPGYALSY